MGHGTLQNSSSSLFSRNIFNNICLKPQVKIVGNRLPQEAPGLIHSGAQFVSILLTSPNLDHAFCPALGFHGSWLTAQNLHLLQRPTLWTGGPSLLSCHCLSYSELEICVCILPYAFLPRPRPISSAYPGYI